MQTAAILKQILIANELGGDLSLVYRFSDPDGVRSGKAGYSFGVCQFDLSNNVNAMHCLAEAGFCAAEISTLVTQSALPDTLARMESKLAGASHTVDRWDRLEFKSIIEHVLLVTRKAGLTLAGENVFYHLADYHNQFHLSPNGKCVLALSQIQGPVKASDVLAYKLTTLWGKKRPDDVERRWKNIVRICGETL